MPSAWRLEPLNCFLAFKIKRSFKTPLRAVFINFCSAAAARQERPESGGEDS